MLGSPTLQLLHNSLQEVYNFNLHALKGKQPTNFKLNIEDAKNRRKIAFNMVFSFRGLDT